MPSVVYPRLVSALTPGGPVNMGCARTIAVLDGCTPPLGGWRVLVAIRPFGPILASGPALGGTELRQPGTPDPATGPLHERRISMPEVAVAGSERA